MERTRRSMDDDRGSSRSRDRDDDRSSSRGRDRGDDDRGGRSRDRDRDEDRGSRRESGRRGGFEYRARDPEAAKRRSEGGGRDFDSFIKRDVTTYKVHDGDNSVRILPPTWDDAQHWGLDVYVHYEIGPDKDSYLCLHKMKGEPCPICEERRQAAKDGDEEYAKSLEPVKRVLMYVLDRKAEKDGIKAWAAPMSIDRDILKVSIDKRGGELLPIDHPEDGYDVDFERTGKGRNTKYVGLSIARRSSPLDNDEALDFAVANPLPTILQYYDYEHIAKVFGGGGASSGSRDRDRSDDRDSGDRGRGSDGGRGRDSGGGERGARDSGRGRDHEDRDARGSAKEDPELTWDTVHAMNYDELCDLVDTQKLDIDPDKSKNDEDLADWVCEEMRIKKEERASRGGRGDDGDAEDRLARMRRGRGD